MTVPSRREIAILGVIAVLLLSAVVVVATRSKKEILVAASPTTTTSTSAAVVIVDQIPEPTAPPPPPAPVADFGPAVGLKVANGQPFRPAIPFTSNIAVPADLVFVLVIGSDARPGQDMTRARADSLHLIAVNPTTMQGTIVGFPRDSWVEIPGHGRSKINSALSSGGPRLMAETVRRLTGLPVHYYVVTGFQGFERLVDDLGGVDVHVDRKMNDSFSGARFQPGWQHFSGAEALAFTRNRHDVPNGDFSRSENQGRVIMATISKIRSEVGDDPGLLGWLGVLAKHVQLDVPADQLPRLAALGRRLDPARVNNVVLPGRVGSAGGQSVVLLTQDAPRLFDDLRADAVIGNAEGYTPPSPPTTAAPTTTAPPETTTTTTSPAAPPTTEAPDTTTTTTSFLGL